MKTLLPLRVIPNAFSKKAGIVAGVLLVFAFGFFSGYNFGNPGRKGGGDRIEGVIAENARAGADAERSLDGIVGVSADIAERLNRSEEQIKDARLAISEALQRNMENAGDYERADALITAIEAVLIILDDNVSGGDTDHVRYGVLNRTH
jgi:hypothetical protein